MHDGNEERLADLLGQAQALMIELSGRCAVGDRDWDKAQRLLEGARQVDAILHVLTREATLPPKGTLHDRKLPYYYVAYDKLVKVGRRRDGGTYKHRVTREHYDLITSRLCEIAKAGATFETQRLVDRCDVPKHEPPLVVHMLSQQGLLANIRRGRWSFTDQATFPKTVKTVWDHLPSDYGD